MRAMAEQLKPKDARASVASQELFVLDVRDKEEWDSHAERIPGSVHIPPDELESRLDELPDDRKILVVCPDGERSAEIAEQIDGDGREAMSLEGGVSQWKKDSLMTQPSPDAAAPKGEDEPPVESPEDDEDEGDGGEAEAKAEGAEPGDEDEADDPGEAEGVGAQATEESDR
jgi:rhodanese-related sulfurtransferase